MDLVSLQRDRTEVRAHDDKQEASNLKVCSVDF